MSYENLLRQYGQIQESAEQRIYIYAQHPRRLATPAEVVRRDKEAKRLIAQLENTIADLKDYRQALAARYAQLETMPYSEALKLERRPHWKGHVEYIITITKLFEDGTSREELRETFRGKDRQQAFKRFAEIKRQRPGITATQDIARRPWE